MNETIEPQGIDFFDFLYEVWRAKWIIAAIIVVMTGLGTATFTMYSKNTNNLLKDGPTIGARAAFQLIVGNDPLERNAAALAVDLATRTDKDGKIGLRFAGIVSVDTKTTTALVDTQGSSFEILFRDGMNLGFVNFAIEGGTKADYEAAYTALVKANEEQAVEARQIAQGTVEALNAAGGKLVSAEQVALADRLVASVQFLATPSVQDNSFRFFALRPLEILEANPQAAMDQPVGRRNLFKGAMAGLLVGLCLSAVLVMFRIALQRKSAS